MYTAPSFRGGMHSDDPVSDCSDTVLDISEDDIESVDEDPPDIDGSNAVPAADPRIPLPSTPKERQAHQLAGEVHTKGWTSTNTTRLFELLTAHNIPRSRRFGARQLCIGAQCARKATVTNWTRLNPYLTTLLVNWVRNTSGLQYFSTITLIANQGAPVHIDAKNSGTSASYGLQFQRLCTGSFHTV
eukprot:5899899-Amphidinium_carterae.2